MVNLEIELTEIEFPTSYHQGPVEFRKKAFEPSKLGKTWFSLKELDRHSKLIQNGKKLAV